MLAAPRRNTELSLLILALILGAGALALVVLALGPDEITLATPIMTVLVVLYIAAHIIMRKVAPKADPTILPTTALLNGIGLAVVYRLGPEAFGPAQVTWTLVGLVLFTGTLLLLRDYHALSSYKYLIGFAGVFMLMLPAFPGIGREVNGARLWVGFGDFQFQPGEFAKVLLVTFFAAYLAERKELLSVASRRVAGFRIPDPKHFGPLVVMWGLSLAVMILEKDLGSSLLFFSIFLVMLYIATARIVYTLLGTLLFALGAWFSYATFGHVRLRVQVWLDVFNPRLINDESYQMAQSLFALATGGLFGTGFGKGRPDLIPAAETDFVFSALGEELGLFGTAAILLCFLLLIGRGLRIALTARDDFGRLLAAGLTAIFGIQTVIILAGVTRLLPLTGITLPFMSYGGSSLLANFVLVAILIRVSHQATDAPPPAATAEILIGGR
jgi:cell division protein FtsW (lipid II flippase)